MTTPKKEFNKGALLIFLSAVMFGSYGVWSRLIGSSLGVFFQGWSRGLVLALTLIPILLLKKQIIPIAKRDWGWLVVFLIFTSATQAPLFYAFNHMDIGSASLIFFVTMLLTMYIVGFVFLKEKFTKVKIVSFGLAIIGLYTMFSFSLEKFSLLAASMAVLNGIASGGEVSFSKKLTGAYSPLYVTLMSWMIVIPTNAFLSIILGERQLLPSLQIFWLWQVCYIFVSLFAFWFVIAGLKHVEASIGGLLGLFEIVFSVLFGIVLFGESLSVKIILGAVLIIMAAALPHLSGLTKRKSELKN